MYHAKPLKTPVSFTFDITSISETDIHLTSTEQT